MAIIQVRVKKMVVAEELEELGIQPSKKEYEWVDKALRSEDICDFESYNQNKSIINFYPDQNRRSVVVAESFEELFKKINNMDYERKLEEIQPE